MTKSQEAQLQLSEVREALNTAIADGNAEEETALKRKYHDAEAAFRKAVSSDTQAYDQSTGSLQNEIRRIRRIAHRVSVRDYLTAAAESTGVAGAAGELNAALGLRRVDQFGGVLIPFEVLRIEQRADAYTDTAALDGGVEQQPILERLFGSRQVLDALGCTMRNVPAGQSELVLVSGGDTPAQTKEKSSHDATAATFSTKNLKPKRLTGRYLYTAEQAAQVPGLEAALVRDLAAAAESAICTSIISGAAPDVSNPQNVEGFLTSITAPTNPSAVATWAEIAAAASQGVDGIHAEMSSQCSVVMGTKSYQYAAAKYQADDSVSALRALQSSSRQVLASSFIPAPASNIQAVLLHAGTKRERGDSVIAMFGGGIGVLRDPYTSASSGGVALTWSLLWDAAVNFRTGAYKRLAWKLA